MRTLMGVLGVICVLLGLAGLVVSSTMFGQISSLILLLIAAVLCAGVAIIESIEREASALRKTILGQSRAPPPIPEHPPLMPPRRTVAPPAAAAPPEKTGFWAALNRERKLGD